MNNDPIKLKDPKGDVPCCETASAVWQTTQQLSDQIVIAGGGEEDVVTDLVATAVDVIGGIAAGIGAISDLLSSPVASPPVPAKLTAPVATTPAAQTNAIVKKGPKDLAQEGKDAIAKREDTQARAAQKQAATVQGNAKVGKSNQVVRGDHNTNNRGGDKHPKAIERKLREQRAADAAKEAAKKKTS